MFNLTTFLTILEDQKELLVKSAVAGSFVLALLDPSFEPNDLDLWVSDTGEENKELILAFAKALGVKETDISLSGSEENEIVSFVYEGMPIQIISWWSVKSSSWYRLIDSFDLECCQLALVPSANSKFSRNIFEKAFWDSGRYKSPFGHTLMGPIYRFCRDYPHEGPEGLFDGMAGKKEKMKLCDDGTTKPLVTSHKWMIPAVHLDTFSVRRDDLAYAMARDGHLPKVRPLPPSSWTCPSRQPFKGWTIWGRVSTFRSIFTKTSRAWRDLTPLDALEGTNDSPYGSAPRMSVLDERLFQARCQKYRDRGYEVKVCDDLRVTSLFTHYKRLKAMINKT